MLVLCAALLTFRADGFGVLSNISVIRYSAERAFTFPRVGTSTAEHEFLLARFSGVSGFFFTRSCAAFFTNAIPATSDYTQVGSENSGRAAFLLSYLEASIYRKLLSRFIETVLFDGVTASSPDVEWDRGQRTYRLLFTQYILTLCTECKCKIISSADTLLSRFNARRVKSRRKREQFREIVNALARLRATIVV